MPQLLALEWDAREARVAVARTRGREVVLEHAFAVELSPRDAGSTVADVNVGEQIAAALATRKVGRCETLAAVGRASIELRQLSIPPAPDEELPDMVRFQALRQFTGIGEDWPLDFVPLESADAGSLNVLAAAISPEIVEQIRRACQAAELAPQRLVLRPFAAASLLRRRSDVSGSACRLMVDLLAEEADLTVLVDDQVSLVRTVRVPAADASGASTRILVGEIRRTMAAAHNQLRDRRIERIILCGAGEEQAALKHQVEQELGQEVDTFDPFSCVALAAELQKHKPEHPGRFAPLLGMLVDEAAGTPHAIDFLHPRRKTAPPNRRRRYALIGTAAAAVVVMLAGFLWLRLTGLDDEIRTLTKATSDLKDSVAEAQKKQNDARVIGEFLDNDIPWLDEMYRLSRELPSSEAVILTQVTLSMRTPAGGQIVLDGFASEHDRIREVEEALRADGRQVVSTGGQYERREGYSWRFKETVIVEPRSKSGGTPTAGPNVTKSATSAPDQKKPS
jgi:Tfp pilus assembly PilM family ATPase